MSSVGEQRAASGERRAASYPVEHNRAAEEAGRPARAACCMLCFERVSAMAASHTRGKQASVSCLVILWLQQCTVCMRIVLARKK